jgi:protein-tyrosine phosphatase
VSVWPFGRQRDGGIDEIPLPASLAPGRLFLCGKHAIAPDVEALMADRGITTVVCLNRERDLRHYPDYVGWLRANDGCRARWLPVPDFSAPPLGAALALLSDLHALLRAGEVVVMHCSAGIGRTGTMAASLLVSVGVSVDDALSTVAANRPMAGPERGVQLRLVQAVAAADNR